MTSPLERYVAAWNEGDLEAWLDTHAPDAEYVTLAGAEPRIFSGHEGLRDAWTEGRANWETFRFSVLEERGPVAEVGYAGVERLQRIELSGVLWFRLEERDGRIARLWSALDPADLE